MTGRMIRKILWTVGCLGLPALLGAQSRLDSLQHLDEVVVTAKPYKEVIGAW